jgi:hypothetical protein
MSVLALILNTAHLEQTVRVFVDHYNSCRPHRSLGPVPVIRKKSIRASHGDWPTIRALQTAHIEARSRLEALNNQ